MPPAHTHASLRSEKFVYPSRNRLTRESIPPLVKLFSVIGWLQIDLASANAERSGLRHKSGRGVRRRWGPRSSRAQLSDPLDRNRKYISEATFGLDYARRARVAFKLASQAQDLHVDAAIEDILVHACRL